MSDSERPKIWLIRRQSIKHKWQVPFIFCVEWPCEWISYWLKEWAFLDILARLGHLAVIVAVIFYFADSQTRQKAKHYQAWQVINLAQGKTGSGGRKDALQDLHKYGINLSGVDVSQAYLPQLELDNAWLSKANLSKANLFGAKLSHAVLQYADLSEADVSEANLSGVFLTRANLSKTNLTHSNLFEAGLFEANLSEANLWLANLWRAKLVKANLSGANFSEANLSEADLSEANLSGANLSGANLWKSDLRAIKNWRDIKSIEKANISGVKNPPDRFIEWAMKNGAVKMKDEEWEKLQREKYQGQTKEK